MKAKVSQRALVARVRRELAKEGEALRACRQDSRGYSELGDWYIVGNNNLVSAKHCDLAALGRELGVLKDFEELSDE
jgi:hypothetical protein